MTERVEEVLLRIRADKAAAEEIRTTIRDLKGDLGSLSQVGAQFDARIAEIGRSNQIQALGQSFGELGRKMQDDIGAAELLKKRLQEIGATQSEINQAAGAFAAGGVAGGGEGGAAGGGGFNLSRLGSKIRSLPSTPIPGTGLATDAIGNLLRVFGALPPAILPVVVLLGGVVAAFALLNKSLEGSKKALDQAIASTKAYYDAIGNSTTTDEAKKRIEDLNREIIAKQAEIDNSTRATSDAFKAAQQTYGDAIARVMFAVGGLTVNTDEAKKQLEALQAEQQGLTRAQEDGSLAAADLAEKEKEIQAIRDKMADQQIARETQMAGLLRNGTEDQVQSRIDALQDENAAIVRVIDANFKKSESERLSADEIKKLTDKLNENNASLQDLQTNVINVVRARDKEVQSAKDQAAAMKDLDKVQSEIDADITKKQEDLVKIHDKYAESLDKLKDNLKEASIEAEIKKNQKLADLLTDLNAKQEQDQENANEKSLKIEEAYQKKRQEIEAEYTRTSTQAIQDRNAVALDAAERKRKDDLTQVEKAKDEQVRELAQNNAALARQRIADYNRRVAEANLAFQREAEQRQRKYQNDVNQLVQAEQQEIAQRKAAFAAQLRDLTAHLSQMMQTQKGYFGSVLNYVIGVRDRINQILGISGAAPAGTANPLYGNGGKIAPTADFDGGASVPRSSGTQDIILSRSSNVRGGAMGGIAVNVSGIGLNKAGVKNIVNKQLDQLLTAAGVA